MTQPKVRTFKRGGSRYYRHPSSDAVAPGVTSVIDKLPKPFLMYWASNVVAAKAVDNVGTVVSMALAGDRAGAIDYLKRAPGRDTGEAADIGTAVHDYVEQRIAGHKPKVHPEFAGFVAGFELFIENFEPEFIESEVTIWSEQYGYAGSLDFIANVTLEGERALVMGDFKTTRSGVHAEVALQLSAYANADYIIDGEGNQRPVPAVEGGLVVHLRPDAVQVVPVRIDEEVFDVFLHLLQGVLPWDREVKNTVIGKPLLKVSFEEES